MMTFDELKARYTNLGVPDAVASNLAGQDLQKLMEDNAKLQQVEREKAALAKAAGVQKFLGYEVSGMREGTVSPSQSKGCKALENGVAVEPAKLGIGDSGETVLYPPKLWVFVAGKTPTYVSQSACAGFCAAMDSMKPENFQAVMRAIGSSEALAAYSEEKKRLVASGEVAGRK